MTKPITVCGREFSAPLLTHVQQRFAAEPLPTIKQVAQEVCELLAWRSPGGQPALSSARVALRKLHRRGLLQLPRSKPQRSHRLVRSAQCLPPLVDVPRRADQVRGLQLYLITDKHDPLHGLWNDLIIEQHPCGDAPLVSWQLRYLIGSEHGWLGAIGFGPAAFQLAARDTWIGWSTRARLDHLQEVVGLSRLLIRQEVRCGNLVSKVLSLALERLAEDWQHRYRVQPLLVETFVDRERFTGRCFGAANWRRIGRSSGRGRLGPDEPVKSLKDIWIYPLSPNARQHLQKEQPPKLIPQPLAWSVSQADWVARELAGLQLGDKRLHRRAEKMLQARWAQPQATFYGTFSSWAEAKGAYGLIEQKRAEMSLENLLAPHIESTQARMAAEKVVLLPQDTTTINYTGLRATSGLGPLGEEKGRGLWLHSTLAIRPDGVPLGVLKADCWARPEGDQPKSDQGRNAKSIDEKESLRWVQALHQAATMARRMPQTQLVILADREGDLYELHDAVQAGPENLHVLIRAQHDRNLAGHQKLWDFMAGQPVGQQRSLPVPRGRGQKARTATVEVRWSPITIEAPAVGCKKGWPSLGLWAVWVREINAPAGVEPIDWMLLTDLPVADAGQAWELVQWYCRRWGIEEWHRALKSGCGIEQREFKTAEHLKRVLAFDLIIAWRVLACLKLGRAHPELPAAVLYTEEELEVLARALKKKVSVGRLTLAEANRMAARFGGYMDRKGDGEPGAESLGIGLRRLADMVEGWKLAKTQRYV
jgi:hypothetical protein